MRTIVLLSIVVTVATASAAPAGAQERKEVPAIAGSWMLDAEKSDDVQKKVTDSFRARLPAGRSCGGRATRGSDGRRGGGGAGTIIDGGGFGGVLNPEAMADLARLLRGPTRLTIERSDSAATLRRDSQPPLVLRLDGSPTTALADEDGVRTMSFKAEWSGDKLTVEAEAEDGTVIEEKYELRRGDRPELRVEVRFTNSRTRQSIKLARVYTPAPA